VEEPFLFRFKKKCLSPNRAELDPSYCYDPSIDMVVDKQTDPPIPAIISPRVPGPTTKKADLEKGEDKKDRRMW
jgi:hypothetical protein